MVGGVEMILFVSGRCDIPAYYSEWFFNRLSAGFVDVRNPFNPHQISRIPLTEQNVDAVLFCTKNPIPLLKRLDEIPFPYLMHVTLTPYHRDIEPNVIDKQEVLNAIKTISERIGKDRIVVRYDPILLTKRYTIEYHLKAFEKLAKEISNIVSTIIISFVDLYKNTKENTDQMGLIEMQENDMKVLAHGIGSISKQYGIHVQTCGEDIELNDYGIDKGACVSKEIMEALLHRPYDVPKGKPVRNCKCLPFVDIGDYNACAHLCKYCYANYDEKQVRSRMKLHNPNATILLGEVSEEDKITIRKEKDHKQMNLF